MEQEVDVSRPLSVGPHKVPIIWWPLVLVVAGEHALQAHTYALHIVHWRPALLVQQIQTYYAVRVDVRVDWYWVFGIFHKDNLGSFDGVVIAEFELQAVRFVFIEGVVVKDADVH